MLNRQLLGYLAFTLMPILGCQSKPVAPTVPDFKDVASISAMYERYDGNSNGWFKVPKEHWQAILNSLAPATPDPNPAGWVSYGDLEIMLTNGKSLNVYLFDVHGNEPGAFAIGKSRKSRTYFRGGNFAKIKESLESAAMEVKGEKKGEI